MFPLPQGLCPELPSHPEYSIHKHNPLQINTYISLKSKQQYHFLESLTTYSSTHQPTLDLVPFLNTLRTYAFVIAQLSEYLFELKYVSPTPLQESRDHIYLLITLCPAL